jgi:hypothetical protein
MLIVVGRISHITMYPGHSRCVIARDWIDASLIHPRSVEVYLLEAKSTDGNGDCARRKHGNTLVLQVALVARRYGSESRSAMLDPGMENRPRSSPVCLIHTLTWLDQLADGRCTE